MDDFEKRVLNFIRDNSMIEAGDSVVVGFSGGADSTALLCVLYELRNVLGISLHACHVNHGIRREAGEDAEFAKEFCREREITFHLTEADIPAVAGQLRLTEEEAGRKVRYEFFEKIFGEVGANKIAIAHHQNDVAETLLLNLFRGTGLHGAGAIRPVRDNIIRPLLCVTREDIEDYLGRKKISFCHDKTNDEDIHTRNKIRNRVLPYVADEINPKAVEHLYRAALEFSKADGYIRVMSELVYDRIAEIDQGAVVIDAKQLVKEPEIIQRDVILRAFEALTPNRKDMGMVHVEAVMGILCSFDGSASVDLPYNLVAVRSYDKLKIRPAGSDEERGREFPLPELTESGQKLELDIPGLGTAQISVKDYNSSQDIPTDTYTKWFDCDRIQAAVFRPRRPEDYIMIGQGDGFHQKKLSKFMTDVKIPSDERDRIYILADGDHVIWVPGYRIGDEYKITTSTNRILAINIIGGGKYSG